MKRKDQVIQKSVGAPLSDSPDEAERRLDNIRPREVSLVDAAANGRSFLVVKRRDNMKPKPKDQSLFKGVVAGEKPEETVVADPPAAQPEGAAAAPAAVVEKGEFEKLADATLNAIPIAKALVMEQKDMFMAMSDALMSFAMGMDMIRMDLMSFMNTDGKTGFMGTEVVKSALKVEFPEASDAEIVEKAGKKMKKDRLMKLKELHASLDSLIKELDDEQSNENVTKGGTVNNQGKGKNDQETQKSADGAAAAPATPATPVVETPAAVAAPLTAEQVGEIVTKAVDKAVAPLKTEIEALKNAPAAPAGESTDSTEEVVAKGADGKPAGKTESIFKGLIR